MTSDRIKEIQKNTAYPNSVSVMIALNQVWNECTQENNQNTKPLIEKISSLEASLLDVTRKSCARVDELKDEIADLKSQLLISEQKVKLNYNCAIESSKSEASDAVTWDSIYIEYMNECPNWKDEKCMSITEWLKLNYNIPTRNNK